MTKLPVAVATDEPTELLRDRLTMIEASLRELVEEASQHHADLNQRVDQVSGTATRQAEVLAAKIGEIQKATQELQILVFGEPKYQLAGLLGELKEVKEVLKTMQVERQSLRDQIKGMRVALTAIGLLGPVIGPAIISWLGELFK